ncbi:MAG TPA: oligosaccharide flippase family protein [Marmoricola sp.]|nr:oligosaccharide flippase family protein [Marmoricola sp.]
MLIGVDTGLVKWLPAQLASGRSSDLVGTLAVALTPMAVLSALGAVVVFAAAPWAAPTMVGAEQAEAMTTMLRVFAVGLPAAAMSDAVLAATRGLGTMRTTVLVENLIRQLVQLIAVGLVYVMGMGAMALALAWVLPYLLSLLLGVLSLRALLRRRATSAGPVQHRARGLLAREFWWYTTPRAIARVTQAALKRSDIVLVAALSTPADAAVYAAATRFVVFGQLLVQSVQQALAPHLSGLFAKNDLPAARAVFQAATLWSMLGSWPIYLVTAVFAEDLLRIFGDGYGAGAPVVIILSLAMLFATAAGPVDSVLLMAGRSWLSLLNNTVALLVNIALNVVLIPAHGITGAAIAWAAAIVLRNTLPLLQVRHSMQMWPATRASGLVAAGALVCFGVTGLSAHLAGGSRMVLVATACIGAACYAVGAGVLRRQLQLEAFRVALTRRRNRASATTA